MANYFDNPVVQGWIEEYLDFPVEERLTNPIPKNLRDKILVEISKIVNGIIFTHHFTIWEDYNDLFQEAMEAVIKALEKFNPNFITSNGTKATAFNYFSLTAKRCLKFYTIRNKKFRNNLDIADYQKDLVSDSDINNDSYELIHKDFINQLKVIFENSKYKKLMPLIDIMEVYLKKMGIFNKRDFFRFAKFHGWSPNLIRKFLKFVKENEDFFYKGKSEKQ